MGHIGRGLGLNTRPCWLSPLILEDEVMCGATSLRAGTIARPTCWSSQPLAHGHVKGHMTSRQGPYLIAHRKSSLSPPFLACGYMGMLMTKG